VLFRSKCLDRYPKSIVAELEYALGCGHGGGSACPTPQAHL